MIHNDVVNQLQLLIKAAAPPLIEVSDTPLDTAQWLPGQKLQAVVMASLPNGRFQVLVSDHELDMNLPRNTQPGEKLDLTFVTAQPRPTFVLTRDLPPAPIATSNTKLSEAAQYLGTLLKDSAPAEGKGQTTAVTRVLPLLPGPPTDVPELAKQLGKALGQSGLFYESHQAEWVTGQRPLAELLQEPQGKLSPRLDLLQTPNPSPSPTTPAAANASVQQPLNSILQQPLAATSERSAAPVDGQIAAAPLSVARELVHPQASGLVQQQLEVLDGRQVVWQGQVWPGQTMQWQIEEREARQGDGKESEAKEWHTNLRLSLPRLGAVEAAINLTPQGLQVKLSTVESTTANAMKVKRGALQQSMESAGLKVLSMAVNVSSGKA